MTVTNGGFGDAVGAVYRPLEEMVPHSVEVQPVPLRLHVTAVLLVPVTVAVNCSVPPTPTAGLLGDTDTETLFEVMVTVVEPVIAEFESDVAVTVTTLGLGADDGAV